MKTTKHFALAALLVLGMSAFSGPAWAITNGEPDDNRHPNVGAIIVYNPANEKIATISGTLIHPRVLLTAGHVVALIESGVVELLGVSFDQEVNLDDPATWLPVSGWVGVSTGFSANPGEIDIGALIFEEPVEGITPATIADPGLLDELKQAGQLQAGPNATRFTVVGYGMLLDWPPPEPYWQEPHTRNTAESAYLGLNDGWLFLSQNLATGYGGTARGDSGGPTFWTDPDTGQEYLVSITSWGDQKWVAIGITYRIDTAESLAFIYDVINSLEGE